MRCFIINIKILRKTSKNASIKAILIFWMTQVFDAISITFIRLCINSIKFKKIRFKN